MCGIGEFFLNFLPSEVFIFLPTCCPFLFSFCLFFCIIIIIGCCWMDFKQWEYRKGEYSTVLFKIHEYLTECTFSLWLLFPFMASLLTGEVSCC